jgi:hypothetical protein
MSNLRLAFHGFEVFFGLNKFVVQVASTFLAIRVSYFTKGMPVSVTSGEQEVWLIEYSHPSSQFTMSFSRLASWRFGSSVYDP